MPKLSKYEPPDMTVRDVAAYYKCSDQTVRNRIARGELSAYRIGNLIRLRRSDVEAALRPMVSE